MGPLLPMSTYILCDAAGGGGGGMRCLKAGWWLSSPAPAPAPAPAPGEARDSCRAAGRARGLPRERVAA